MDAVTQEHIANASGYEALVADALGRVRRAPCKDLEACIGCDGPSQDTLLIDLREPHELTRGMLPGAINIPRGVLERQIGSHADAAQKRIYVYCETGKRSALAADTLARMGYADVYTLDGGFTQWRQQGFTIVGAAAPTGTKTNGVDWCEVRHAFSIVEREVPLLGGGSQRLVYLDHAASTHAPDARASSVRAIHRTRIRQRAPRNPYAVAARDRTLRRGLLRCFRLPECERKNRCDLFYAEHNSGARFSQPCHGRPFG